MENIKARDYQVEACKQIHLGKRNLIVLPMRAGKSFLCKYIIDQYQFKKVLIITGFRKIVIQFEQYFPDSHTHILAGKDYDHQARVTLASFQTYHRRKIDISQFDCIIVDEYHSRLSKNVETFLSQATGTIILLTGTPLQANNRFITKGIDNVINTINVTQMMKRGYLAPTRFMANKSVIGDEVNNLTVKRGEYDEEEVKQVIQKSYLLDAIVDLVDKEELATKHKTLVYLNFISTAEELYDKLKDKYDNIFILHSKLSEKEQTKVLDSYQTCSNSLIISIRSLSLGFDSPSSDRLIFGILSRVVSLNLQILWRASTLDPKNPDKEAIVYDMLGALKTGINPYTDFSEYSKKPTCREKCEKLLDPIDKWFCIDSCSGSAPTTECNGELSQSQQQNPYLTDYTIHTPELEPCGELVPLYEMKYETEEIDYSHIKKHTTCKCGYHTSYVLQTASDPADFVLLQDEFTQYQKHCGVTCLYDRNVKRAIAIFDDPNQSRYKIFEFTNSNDIYTKALKFFSNRPFTITSNIKMSKLPNVTVNRELDAFIPLLDWSLKDQKGIVKKIIKAKLQSVTRFLGMRDGFSYYFMKVVNPDTEKQVMEFLNSENIDRRKLVKFKEKMEKLKG